MMWKASLFIEGSLPRVTLLLFLCLYILLADPTAVMYLSVQCQVTIAFWLAVQDDVAPLLHLCPQHCSGRRWSTCEALVEFCKKNISMPMWGLSGDLAVWEACQCGPPHGHCSLPSVSTPMLSSKNITHQGAFGTTNPPWSSFPWPEQKWPHALCYAPAPSMKWCSLLGKRAAGNGFIQCEYQRHTKKWFG